ncbi:MAG TPA: hypothetical protein VGB96_15345, partial [Archangium sp.]
MMAVVYANFTTFILSGRYSQLTFGEQIDDSFPLILKLLGLFSCVAIVGQVFLGLRRLRGLLGVEAAEGASTPEQLGQALGEVH